MLRKLLSNIIIAVILFSMVIGPCTYQEESNSDSDQNIYASYAAFGYTYPSQPNKSHCNLVIRELDSCDFHFITDQKIGFQVHDTLYVISNNLFLLDAETNVDEQRIISTKKGMLTKVKDLVDNVISEICALLLISAAAFLCKTINDHKFVESKSES